jgi:CheY-like chemotaxis protein
VTERNTQKPPLIMVVDDEWMNREMLQAYLEGAGYEVVLVASGPKALELAAARPPDLVLLDVRMTGMNGYEVCARLKATEATRYTPVLMVTGLVGDDDKRQALNAGADDFIPKPLDSLIMLNRIKSLLRVKHLYDELHARNVTLRTILKRYVDDQTLETIMADVERI